MLSCAVAGLCFGAYWLALAFAIYALSAYPSLLAPAPRVHLDDDRITIRPKVPLANSYYVFPFMFAAGSTALTVQWASDSASLGTVRMPIFVALSWFVTVASGTSAIRYSGSLRVTPEALEVGRSFFESFDQLRTEIVQQNRWAFPFIWLSRADSGQRLRRLFPTMSYGIEANALNSALTHLMAVDPAIRRTYAPELVESMFLFVPQCDMSAGESRTVTIDTSQCPVQ